MKLGTQVYHPKTYKLRTGAVADLALRGRGSDFHIWLPCPQNLGINGLQILLSYFSLIYLVLKRTLKSVVT